MRGGLVDDGRHAAAHPRVQLRVGDAEAEQRAARSVGRLAEQKLRRLRGVPSSRVEGSRGRELTTFRGQCYGVAVQSNVGGINTDCLGWEGVYSLDTIHTAREEYHMLCLHTSGPLDHMSIGLAYKNVD